MIKYETHTLSNGLRILLHEDRSTPLVAVNMLYDVGSRDEQPERTGFAHLFEHLMFGGSDNAPSFDDPIQEAGGDCNAFTNSDLTNFYSILPAQNIELALFLEADRMSHLSLNERTLSIQRDVVVEEFKETCLNQPYGDMWHLLAPLAYHSHPYRWPTIGESLSHIAEASIDDVANFYRKFYGPGNAVCTIAGNVSADHVFPMMENLFGGLESRLRPDRRYPVEPPQREANRRDQSAQVPVDALYMAFHMDARHGDLYYTHDLISDLLASGKSSRLFAKLVKEQRLCSQVDAYVTGTLDPGLLIVEANPVDGVALEKIEASIWEVLNHMGQDQTPQREFDKHLNKIESSIHFSNSSILNKAMNLAYFALIGQTELINTEHECYRKITPEQIQRAAAELFRQDNCSVLTYRAA